MGDGSTMGGASSPANPFMSDDAFSPNSVTAPSGWTGVNSSKEYMLGYSNFSAINGVTSPGSPSMFGSGPPYSNGGYVDPQSAFMQPHQMHMGMSTLQTNFPPSQNYRQQHGQITPPSAGSSIKRPSSDSLENSFGGEDASEADGQRSTQHSTSQTKMEQNESASGLTPPIPKKRRRGRKAKDAQPDDQDEQRQKFLERNRLAATKCRQKKKAWTNDLEDRARTLTAERTYLKAVECSLRQEILDLKSRCLQHVDCNCQAIRAYLSSTVATMRPPVMTGYTQGPDGSQRMHQERRESDDLMAHFGLPPNFNEESGADNQARSKSMDSHPTTDEDMAAILATENARDENPT